MKGIDLIQLLLNMGIDELERKEVYIKGLTDSKERFEGETINNPDSIVLVGSGE